MFGIGEMHLQKYAVPKKKNNNKEQKKNSISKIMKKISS